MGDGSKTMNRIHFSNKGQIGSAQLYYLAKRIGLRPRLSVRKKKKKKKKKQAFDLLYGAFKNYWSLPYEKKKKKKKTDNIVTKVECYKYKGKDVYDLETVNGTFQAGVGEIIIHSTDSLAYEIQTEDFYKDISPDVKCFDTSNYPADHPSGSRFVQR